MHFIINSVPVSKFKLWTFKVFNLHFVTFEFACLRTINNIVIFSEILVAPPILEEHGV